MRVFVKSCCRAIGMTLALVWVPRISEAADHQVWLKLSIDVPIFAPWDDGRIVFDAEQEEKFGKRGFIDSETLAMIKLEACPYFAIRLGDRFVYERSRGRGDLVPEHRPTLDVVLTTPEFLTLKLDSRTRFEYRMIDGKDDHMRYRERLRLKTEWSVTRWKISPFVSEELFFSDRQGGSAANAFVRNRAQIGLSFVPFPSLPALVCNTYYMVQHDWAESGWEPINVYGLECAYKF